MTIALADTAPTDLLPAELAFTDARRRVFEAAVVLFAERGYHAVSVRDIATLLDLKPMALYAHVASKQELLFEIVSIGITTHRARLTEALLDAGREPADQIRALSRAHVAAHLAYPALARVTSRDTAALSEEQQAEAKRLSAESAQLFLDVIDRGQRLGAFTDDNPALLVQAVAAMGLRAAEWWTPESDTSADEVTDAFADFAVRLLTGGNP